MIATATTGLVLGAFMALMGFSPASMSPTALVIGLSMVVAAVIFMPPDRAGVALACLGIGYVVVYNYAIPLLS